jgi:hypothetical protein
VATIRLNSGVVSTVEVRGWADLVRTHVQVLFRNTAFAANPIYGPDQTSISRLSDAGVSITAQIVVSG